MRWARLAKCQRVPWKLVSFRWRNYAAEAWHEISVHKGLKIQGALCVERPPLQIVEPDYKQKWRAFKEAWDLRTGNHLTMDDEIVFMRFHFHFLQDKAATQALAAGEAPALLRGLGSKSGGGRKRGSASKLATSVSTDTLVAAMSPKAARGLDSLVGEEGVDLAFPELGRKAVKRRKVEKRKEEKVDDSDQRSLRRLRSHSLFLLVRYKNAKHWTFPKADRLQGQGMRETLLGLADNQLGPDLRPYLVGACPFSYRKRLSNQNPGIQGRKIFYYRARLLPSSEVALPETTPVSDWAWFNRQELESNLEEGEWLCKSGIGNR
ncbi:unnamed protein product [Durusdinium trenchii]|uniref:Ribosomal protein L46 N-terminal domain-containing protein n=1 Tax=Durusdinium trenchii TaxID=1381693 RepID=A0ABP0MD42_9DINO